MKNYDFRLWARMYKDGNLTVTELPHGAGWVLQPLGPTRGASVMYTAGYEEKKDSYGMFYGPSPSIDDVLDGAIPTSTRHPAYILKMKPSGKVRKIYYWDFKSGSWSRVGPDGRLLS